MLDLARQDSNVPDFQGFPRRHVAIAAGRAAHLAPGDLLFYPASWWHHVEALDSFNVLNWWNPVPRHLDSPQTTLLHAMSSVRGRPAAEKRARREIFDYDVFGPSSTAARHLPENARGKLGPMDDQESRRLRASLLARRNR